MDLLKRRAEVAARAKVLVSVSGSGRHKDDPQEAARLKLGDKPLTEKLIGLKDDDRVYFVGPCVAKAKAGLQAYADSVAAMKKKARDEDFDLEWSPVERHAMNVCKRVLADPSEAIIVLPTQDWNGVLFALSQSGIQCVITDANITPEEEQPNE